MGCGGRRVGSEESGDRDTKFVLEGLGFKGLGFGAFWGLGLRTFLGFRVWSFLVVRV